MAGIAETNRIPRPPAAVDCELGLWFRDDMNVPTGRRRLNGAVLLGSKRTPKKLAENGALGDRLGQGLYDGITKNGLKRAEGDEFQEAERVVWEEY
jgi:hypothetical protein